MDANRFTAVVYRDGKARARCKIGLGGMMGTGNLLLWCVPPPTPKGSYAIQSVNPDGCNRRESSVRRAFVMKEIP